MKKRERWKPVLGMEGSYSVSNLGRVRSEECTIIHKNGSKHRIKEKILRELKIPGNPYKRVVLGRDERGRSRRRKVYKLVLEAFVGPRPEGTECRHLDGDPSNNELSNLCWGTKKENAEDRVRHGRQVSLTGEDHPLTKLTNKVARQIRDTKNATNLEVRKRLAAKHSVAIGVINGIVFRKTWRFI